MLLNLISDAGRITAGGLAARTLMQKQQVTTVLNQLEDKGLIERTRQNENRRTVWLSTTESGSALLDEIHADFNAQLSAVFEQLDDAALDKYIDAMHTINDILAHMSAAAPSGARSK